MEWTALGLLQSLSLSLDPAILLSIINADLEEFVWIWRSSKSAHSFRHHSRVTVLDFSPISGGWDTSRVTTHVAVAW
jgi:hypothetical protein